MGGSLCIYYATILPLPIDTAAADDRRSTIDEQNKKQHNMIDNDYDPENDGETCVTVCLYSVTLVKIPVSENRIFDFNT